MAIRDTLKKIDTIGGILPGGAGKIKPEKSQAQANCEAKGGVWSEADGTCSLPEPKAVDAPKQIEATKTGRFDAEKQAYITNDGRTYPTSNPDFVPPQQTDQAFTYNQDGTVNVRYGNTEETLTEEEFKVLQGESGNLTNKVKALQTAPTFAEEKLQNSISQIGQVGQLTEAEQASINFSQAITAGLSRVVPAAVGGAAVGAAAGAVTTGGLASAPAALAVGAAGAVGGLVSGILSNIKEQQRGELQASDIVLKNARTNMRQLAMLASQDPTRADVYIELYNNELTKVNQARRQTKVETNGDLNAFMEDGREQLADFDEFLRVGGTSDIYKLKLEIALQTNTPLSEEDLILGDDLLQ